MVKESRIIGNRNIYTWEKFVIVQKQWYVGIKDTNRIIWNLKFGFGLVMLEVGNIGKIMIVKGRRVLKREI